jgi:hypothetical protein
VSREGDKVILEPMDELFPSAGFDEPPFDLEDAREAGEIRAELEAKGTPIGPYDTRIAAQARRCGAALVTLNRSELKRVPGLKVEDWEGSRRHSMLGPCSLARQPVERRAS